MTEKRVNIIELKIENKDFNLDHIFDCGQCFRWEKEEDGSYTGVAYSKACNMNYDGHLLRITEAAGEARAELWERYLDLGRDYNQIKADLARDQKMGEAIRYGYGIRILKQEAWEALISFIVSQNNNIPRIKGCIEKMAELFGEPLGEFRGKERFAFPTAQKLASLSIEDLAPVRLGYRAGYILDTAKCVVQEGFVDSQDIEKYLGVGPKVANCIKLFGLQQYDSFPIDVWMKKIMNHLYGLSTKKEMEDYANAHFGVLGGFAQQYLFYYARGLEELK